jgi:hypothetical protein
LIARSPASSRRPILFHGASAQAGHFGLKTDHWRSSRLLLNGFVIWSAGNHNPTHNDGFGFHNPRNVVSCMYSAMPTDSFAKFIHVGGGSGKISKLKNLGPTAQRLATFCAVPAPGEVR